MVSIRRLRLQRGRLSIQLPTDRAADLTTKWWLFFHAEFPGN